MNEKNNKEKKGKDSIKLNEWKAFFNGMIQPAIILDPKRGIIAANKAILNATGLDERDVLGRKCFELFHGAGHPPNGCPLEKIISAGEAGTVEMEMETIHGTFLVSCTPAYDESMRLNRIIHILTDITEIKKAEKALKESEERYRIAIEGSNECVAIVKEGKYIYLNKKFLETFELNDSSELLNKPFGSFIHPDDRERMLEYNRARNRGEYAPSTYEFRAIKNNGDIVYFDASINLITYKGESAALAFLKDITERKKAEQALKDSEIKYRSIFENAVEGIFQSTPEGRFNSVNPAMARMCGFESPEEMILSVTDIKNQHYVKPEERDEYRRIMDANGVVENFEHQIYRKDGAKIWVSTNSRAVKDEDGNVLFYEGTHENITKRKNIEDALKKNEAMLQSILRASAVGIGLLIDRVFVWVNDYVTFITGYTKDDLLGKSARIFYENDEEFLRVGTEKYAEIREKGKGSVETRWKRKDGQIVDIFLSSVPIDSQDLSAGVVFTALDITSEKRAKTALKASEEKFRMIAELLPQTIFETDITGNLTYANRHSFEQFGYTGEDIAKGISVFDMIAPEERLKAVHNIEMTLKSENKAGREYLAVRKDGATFPIYVYSTPIIKDGRPAGLRGIAVDISERKKAEEARKTLEMQLMQSQKMEAVGKLAGGIAHDFNNILTTIIGYSELALMKMQSDNPVKGYIKNILSSSQRAANLTRGLLAFSRKQVMELKPLNINDIIHAAKIILERLLTEDITLKIELADENLVVMADEAQLTQVLMNLATNAKDAMPDGGDIYINIRRFVMDEGFVDRNAFGDKGDYALISFSDTGNGIEKDIIDKIYEPFFTTKEVGKGTGLGLAIVYGVVKQHKGYINVYSEKGKGTNFNIYIPLVRMKPEIHSVNNEDVTGGNETILIAEDNHEVRQLTKTILESKGYKVIEAIDGVDAIKRFEQNKGEIDMVILDVVMPNKNGQEANEAIQKIKPGVPVIFVSGYTADIVLGKGVNGSAINYISKPLIPDDLLRKVRAVIDKTKTPL